MGVSENAIIRVEHLTAAYEGDVIIDNVSFEVNRGEVFVILGASGCGKTPEAHEWPILARIG